MVILHYPVICKTLIWQMQIFSLLLLENIQFSCRSVVSNSLRPHEPQHARPPCPSPTPRVHSNSRPSSQWCYPAISSSIIPLSSFPQSLSASESFPVSQLFAWGGQSTGVSALASFLPKNTQDWSPLEWTGCISLQSLVQSLNWVDCCVIISSGLKEKMFYVPKTKEGRGKKKKKKDVCPFLLLENSRPLSPPQESQTSLSLGTLDFLSTCLGIDSLNNKDHLFSTAGSIFLISVWDFIRVTYNVHISSANIPFKVI